MDTTEPTVDPVAGARHLIEWVEDPRVGPLGLGYALDLWLALTGNPTDPDDEDYEAGIKRAIATAYDLAHPPEPPRVVDVEVVRGEVL